VPARLCAGLEREPPRICAGSGTTPLAPPAVMPLGVPLAAPALAAPDVAADPDESAHDVDVELPEAADERVVFVDCPAASDEPRPVAPRPAVPRLPVPRPPVPRPVLRTPVSGDEPGVVTVMCDDELTKLDDELEDAKEMPAPDIVTIAGSAAPATPELLTELHGLEVFLGPLDVLGSSELPELEDRLNPPPSKVDGVVVPALPVEQGGRLAPPEPPPVIFCPASVALPRPASNGDVAPRSPGVTTLTCAMLWSTPKPMRASMSAAAPKNLIEISALLVRAGFVRYRAHRSKRQSRATL
jgi:hypothetical protein